MDVLFQFDGLSVEARFNDTSTAEVIESFLTERFKNWTDEYGILFYAAVVLGVFLITKGLAPIIYWPAMGLSFIIYQILPDSKKNLLFLNIYFFLPRSFSNHLF